MTRPRVRIGTLMLVVIIAALAVALAREWRRSAESEAALLRGNSSYGMLGD